MSTKITLDVTSVVNKIVSSNYGTTEKEAASLVRSQLLQSLSLSEDTDTEIHSGEAKPAVKHRAKPKAKEPVQDS